MAMKRALQLSLFTFSLLALVSCAGRKPFNPKASISLTRGEVTEMLALMETSKATRAAQRKEWMVCEADGCVLEGKDDIVYAGPAEAPGLKWKASVDLRRPHARALLNLMDLSKKRQDSILYESDVSRLDCTALRCRLRTRGPAKGNPKRFEWIGPLVRGASQHFAE